MPSRQAVLLFALLLLLPTAWRTWTSRPVPPRSCVPEGRGSGDDGWVGCATDPGPRRILSGRERMAFGLPVPLNAASAADLAQVPGLTPRLAAEIVSDRGRRGPFPTVDSLDRVVGIGPRRLEQARGHLVAE